jgi:hypothetical protein
MGPRVRALFAGAVLAAAAPAAAHQGPPYAMFVDRAVGPYTLSVWGDPDVGTGTFYVIFEDAPPSLDPTVEIAVRPLTGRLPEAAHPARRQALRDRVQYLAEVPFADGLGPLDLALYGAPFAAIAALWLRMFLRRPRPCVTRPPVRSGGEEAP